MLRFGYITEVDAGKGYARVKFMDDDIVSDWLQVVVHGATGNRYFHTFEVNEQVACLMDNHSEEGVILGATYNDKNTANGSVDIVRVQFSDDSYIEYNKNSHELNINIKGKINITADSEVNIEAPVVNAEGEIINVDGTTINITGEVIATGNLTVSGAVTAASISAASIGGAGVTMEGGNLEAEGEVKGATVVAGTIDLQTHTHSGVQTGGGTSGPPVP